MGNPIPNDRLSDASGSKLQACSIIFIRNGIYVTSQILCGILYVLISYYVIYCSANVVIISKDPSVYNHGFQLSSIFLI